ncbi:glutathione S-transferase [Thalassotalea castellviae]|uniref:Glutathione S-transferase n=1 Tax=Thalassotalea castellviae TaxID=3075612 RepID=A0ABU2ZWE8_9GAMM|nr:glutathione S-transferase [Thalassotalea sp. W431]MDT0602239.1 glutathione S-transferase [Thalassotalea sp. W431]
MNDISQLPILYSLRHCPFAMRARLALFKAKRTVVLRDIVLSNKPQEMLDASPKATVPVLVLSDGTVIEESLDIMLWAFQHQDPADFLHKNESDGHICKNKEMMALISTFDVQFKACLENYKCAKRYHEANLIECRQACEVYLLQLEQRLTEHQFLISNHESLADIALLPFIRQFARIERQWYLQAPYPKVREWLNKYLQSALFTKVMAKHPLWQKNQAPLIFSQR